ncbi:hypothetical protein F5882DRAFT_423713 [Hyaloscypha sp. PMI_1271]|nr:hypothetical protein F5882DRAFT_423713 [Hyaloscypha sp. PMI_1271]
MQSQIHNLVRKEAMKLEAEVLSELERILYSSQSIGSQNPIAIWVCLWLLLLYYKSHLTFIWGHGGRASVTDPIYSLGRHLYNAITSIYSALYKTTTPLTFDWRKEEISKMLGRDSELIKSFCNIKTEMFWLHAERNGLLDEDSLFKTLVVENDSKLQESSKKAARQQGIL